MNVKYLQSSEEFMQSDSKNSLVEKFRRIHIFGASGSGVSTFGQYLAESWKIPVFDFDNYYWAESEVPFSIKRNESDRWSLLQKDLSNYSRWIISGHYSNPPAGFDNKLDLAVFLYVPAEIRLERVRQREASRYGSRILPGGDMYKIHLDFIEFCKSYDENIGHNRTLERHQQRLAKLSCRSVGIAGNLTLAQSLKILEQDLRG